MLKRKCIKMSDKNAVCMWNWRFLCRLRNQPFSLRVAYKRNKAFSVLCWWIALVDLLVWKKKSFNCKVNQTSGEFMALNVLYSTDICFKRCRAGSRDLWYELWISLNSYTCRRSGIITWANTLAEYIANYETGLEKYLMLLGVTM